MEEICRAFRNTGKCRYGEKCKHEHSEGEPIAEPPRGQCNKWAESGSCDFGDKCRFLHGPEDDGSRFVKKPRAPRAPRAPKAEGEEGAAGTKKKSGRARKPRKSENVSEEICNNWLEGKCRYGADCRRVHEGEIPQTNIVKIDEICNNFVQGRCKFGDLCRRKHVTA